MTAFRTRALHGFRLGKNRVKRRDDRHGQPREQRHDVTAGLPTENAELMLQAYKLELLRIQEVSSARVIL